MIAFLWLFKLVSRLTLDNSWLKYPWYLYSVFLQWVGTIGLLSSTFLFDLYLLAPSSCFFFAFKKLLMAHTNCTDTDAESQIYTHLLIPSSSSRVQGQNVENLLWISLFFFIVHEIFRSYCLVQLSKLENNNNNKNNNNNTEPSVKNQILVLP